MYSIEKAERQLNDKEHYRQLPKDQTAANNETVSNVTKNVAEGPKSTSPRTPRFYIQPKRHKHGNPGRPEIRSFNNFRTSIC